MALPFFTPAAYAVFGVVLVAGYFLYRAALPKPIPGIPYHTKSANRILGDAPDMLKHVDPTGKTNIFKWMGEQGEVLDSPIYQLFPFPFAKPMVYVTDHREAMDVMIRRGKEFDRSNIFRNLFGGTAPEAHMVMSSFDPRFKGQRRLVADTMSTSFLSTVGARQLYRQSIHLVKLWHLKSKLAGGHPYQLSADINQMSLDAIWGVSFGADVDTVATKTRVLREKGSELMSVPYETAKAAEFKDPELPPEYKALQTLINDVGIASNSPFPKQAHWLRRQTKAWKRAKALSNGMIQERLDDAKSRLLGGQEDKEDQIDSAIAHVVFRENQAAIKEGRTPQFDSQSLKDELFSFLFAGSETVAGVVMWTLKELADDQEVQKKLRSALRAAYPDEAKSKIIPSGESIASTDIPYLDAVMEEVLRTRTIGTVRLTVQDTEILGYRIPKGHDVMFLTSGPGVMRPDKYKDNIPEKDRSETSRANKDKVAPDWNSKGMNNFDPERWMSTGPDGQSVFNADAGPSRPFGAGNRGCFGRKLAMLELRLVVTMLIWSFDFPTLSPELSLDNEVIAATIKPMYCYGRPIWLLD